MKYLNKQVSENKIQYFFRNYYRERIIDLYKFSVFCNSSVLQVGCGNGRLLSALNPKYGVGIDISYENIKTARHKYPSLKFIEADALDFYLGEKFDYIIVSDVINELWDIHKFFIKLRNYCNRETRILITINSNLWKVPRKLATKLGLAEAKIDQNWISPEDLTNILNLAGFDVVRRSREILLPIYIPLISNFINKYVVKIQPFAYFGLINFIAARVIMDDIEKDIKVSIIIPARNEAGNIAAIIKRTPHIGNATELIFVEGGSQDGTYEEIENQMKMQINHMKLIKLIRQPGKGKGDAVRAGIKHATGPLIMILDSDLSVAPEDLPMFYRAWINQKADFINGSRMVYPIDNNAMPFINMIGNYLFSIAFTYVLGQQVKDTACGTKVISKRMFERIVSGREKISTLDEYGDWDLLFGASKYNLKIIDLPVRYHKRLYGTSKMQRWKTGFLLTLMVMMGLKKVKFV